jgi:hypothetical protein
MSDEPPITSTSGLHWSPTRSAITMALLEVRKQRIIVEPDRWDESKRTNRGEFVPYVSIDRLISVIDPILWDVDLVTMCGAGWVSPHACVVTLEACLAGTEEWVRSSCLVGLARPVARQDAAYIEGTGKALGGAITAGRRHLTLAMFNIMVDRRPPGSTQPREGDPSMREAPPPQRATRGPTDIQRTLGDFKAVDVRLFTAALEVLRRAGHRTDHLPPDCTDLFKAIWKAHGNDYKAAKAAQQQQNQRR